LQNQKYLFHLLALTGVIHRFCREREAYLLLPSNKIASN
jgi:hypothetical protein